MAPSGAIFLLPWDLFRVVGRFSGFPALSGAFCVLLTLLGGKLKLVKEKEVVMFEKLGHRKYAIPFVAPFMIICLFALMFFPMANM